MTALPALIPNRLALLVPDKQASELMPALIAQLALGGALRVVDAGNCFAAHAIAREIRRSAANPIPILKRIQVARAFTCYQALALLAETPSGAFPVLALDLLATFYDENVRLAERCRLLTICARELQRLSRQASVGVIVYLRQKQPDTPVLLEILEDAADQVWRLEPAPPVPPARLF